MRQFLPIILVVACAPDEIAGGALTGEATSETSVESSSDATSYYTTEVEPFCVPGTRKCDGVVILECDQLGEAFFSSEKCDFGSVCQEGECVETCPSDDFFSGCNFYPTVTSNFYTIGDPFYFGIVVANTSTIVAKVNVELLGVPMKQIEIAPSAFEVIQLEWIYGLSGSLYGSRMVEGGAYKVQSSSPVRVWQFNPLEEAGTVGGTLLIPRRHWSKEYWNVAFSGTEIETKQYPSFVTVTAASLAQVEIVSEDVDDTPLKDQIANLDEHDVLQIVGLDIVDLTGAKIVASQPIQAIGGATCSFVPFGAQFCDHLEEALLPTEMIGTEYVAITPAGVGSTEPLQHIVRILSTVDDTEIAIRPGGSEKLVEAGSFLEIGPTEDSLWIRANQPVIVVQYRVGDSFAPGSSDPSMLLTPIIAQKESMFVVIGDADTHVDIVTNNASPIELDGESVVGGVPLLANPKFVIYRVRLQTKGIHRLHSSDSFAASLYGLYGPETMSSYWTRI